ncbi:MAG TPA: hypothetical protein VK911_16180 [Vicinamibacterales bacterium]|nr:hypothetical protein [Vicinamibacterales bacterium]
MSMSRGIVVALMLLAAASAGAQEQEQDQGRLALAVIKEVALDPTTYAPALIAWGATHLDWQSSQVFFENGWWEQNPRFTVSGRAGDTAIGYGAGNQKIFLDALATLRLSLINNVPERAIEALLIRRYPQHRTLLRTLGWIERTGVASYWAYRLSARHFRQWRENERRARQLGYR